MRRNAAFVVLVLLLAAVSLFWLVAGYHQPTDIRFPHVYGSAAFYLDETAEDTDGYPLNFLLIAKNGRGLSDFIKDTVNGGISFDNEKITASISSLEKGESAGSYTTLGLTVRVWPKDVAEGDQIRLEHITLGGRTFDLGQLTLYPYASREKSPEILVTRESIATFGAGLPPYHADFTTGPDSFFITCITAAGYDEIVPTLSFQEKQVSVTGTAVEIPPNVDMNLEIDFSASSIPDAEVYYVVPCISVQSTEGRESSVRLSCLTCGLYLTDTEIINLGNRMFLE